MGGEVGSAIARAGGQEVRNLVNELHKTYGNLGVCSGKFKNPILNHIHEFNYFSGYEPSKWKYAL